MVHALEGLIQDAASLHRLVDSIQQFCGEQIASQAYPAATKEFLGYAQTAANGTKQAVAQHVLYARSLPNRIQLTRSRFLLLKDYWRLLHTYVKPATDAHRLRIPVPLLDLATEQLRKIQGMAGANVVVLLTPHLMYFQKPHTRFKKLAGQLAMTVPSANLPDKLGFVELPYSLAPNLLSNLIVYHELGHFVLEEFEATQHPEIAKLRTMMVECLRTHVNGFDNKLQDAQLFDIERLEYWAHEIFCDLFALRILGPAFSFAAVEFFSLLGLMHRDHWVRFSASHPAPSCRFAEHRRQLKMDGWWTHVGNMESEHATTIKKLAAIPRADYLLSLQGKPPAPDPLMKAFFALLPTVRQLVAVLTKGAVASPAEFGEFRSKIEEYLLNGVVPSTIVARRLRHIPPATAIINAAVCFQLTSIPKLMRHLPDQDPSDVAGRSRWIRQLEPWTMKAIEDVQLMERYRALN